MIRPVASVILLLETRIDFENFPGTENAAAKLLWFALSCVTFSTNA